MGHFTGFLGRWNYPQWRGTRPPTAEFAIGPTNSRESRDIIALLTLFGKNPKNQLISLDLKMDIPMETVTFLPVRPWVHRTAYPQKMGIRGGLLSERGLQSTFRYARLFS
jgi:hypothetical protein